MPDADTPEVGTASHSGAVSQKKTYYVYVLECEDGSLYSGITTDVARRMSEHLGQRPPGARYTQLHRPVALVGLWSCEGRSLACKLEWRLHHASRARKLELLAVPELAGGEWEAVDPGARAALWAEAAGGDQAVEGGRGAGQGGSRTL